MDGLFLNKARANVAHCLNLNTYEYDHTVNSQKARSYRGNRNKYFGKKALEK